jgi:hypothetical protein
MQYDNYDDLIGKRLLHGILNAKGVMLIPDETILSPIHVEKLKKFQIDLFDIHVESVEEEQSAIVTPSEVNPSLEFIPIDTHELVKRTETQMQEVNDFVYKNGKVPVADIEDKILPFIMEVSKKRNIYQLFSEL